MPIRLFGPSLLCCGIDAGARPLFSLPWARFYTDGTLRRLEPAKRGWGERVMKHGEAEWWLMPYRHGLMPIGR